MSFWIYKANARQPPPLVGIADWDYFFDRYTTREWGNTKWTRPMDGVVAGDLIIAHQTDRQEIVGLAQVVDIRNRRDGSKDLVLRPVETYRVSLREIRGCDARIDNLTAFRRGPRQAIYSISTADAWHLLNVVKAHATLQSLTAAE